MKILTRQLDQWARIITLLAVVFTICMGSIMVLAEVKPFWIDEWFIIYNIKTKTFTTIWGKLDLMQQFPRVYLYLFKLFTSWFNYSYFSLRVVSFVLGILVIGLCYKLMKKMYAQSVFSRYLFILFIISSFTFTEYFVGSKQYTMDILLSLIAVWQMLQLLQRDVTAWSTATSRRYLLLVGSFIVAPFLSYTYPIAVAPVFAIAALKFIDYAHSNLPAKVKLRAKLLLAMPLLGCAASIVCFYLIDVRQLMVDNAMYGFWNFVIFDPEHKLASVSKCGYRLFSQMGSGIVFENIIGVLGCIAFVSGCVASFKHLKRNQSIDAYTRLYCCILLLFTIVLFLLRKLPLGEPRLNAYTMPSIAILMIWLMEVIAVRVKQGPLKTI